MTDDMNNDMYVFQEGTAECESCGKIVPYEELRVRPFCTENGYGYTSTWGCVVPCCAAAVEHDKAELGEIPGGGSGPSCFLEDYVWWIRAPLYLLSMVASALFGMKELYLWLVCRYRGGHDFQESHLPAKFCVNCSQMEKNERAL